MAVLARRAGYGTAMFLAAVGFLIFFLYAHDLLADWPADDELQEMASRAFRQATIGLLVIITIVLGVWQGVLLRSALNL